MNRDRAVIYSWEVDALVKSQIPKQIRDAMESLGWNAFGVYELVKRELQAERRRLKRSAGAESKKEPTV